MKIVWSQPAIADLEAIHDFIERDAPGRAARFVERLITSTEPLLEFPRMGRVVPEGDGRQREITVGPYRIIYRVEAGEIFVVTVVHGSRDLVELWRARQ
jgi:toxin ParE1/3/4